MSEKAETRAVQAAKETRATTAKVANLESRVAFLEQDAPEPMPVLPKQAERVEQQDVVIPQSWQVRAFDTTDRTDVNNIEYKAEFQIYNPVLLFGGVPKSVAGGGTGWTKLAVETPLSASQDVVARVTYTVEADGERSFESAEIAIKNAGEQPPAAGQGKAIDDIQIATLHSSGWDAITQHQTGPIYLGGGGGGVAQKDYSVYITKVPAAESKSKQDEYWLAQGRVLCSWCVEKQDEKGNIVTETCSVEVPEFYILRLDASFMDMGIHQGSRTFGDCTKLYCSLYRKKMCWDDGCSDIENYAKQYCVIPKEMLPYGCIEETDPNYCVLMTAFETCWAQGLCVNHPEDDTQQGCLSGYAACGTFFGLMPPYVPEEPDVYFYTEISDVNIDNSTYSPYEV